uniref:Uncharacterized protein n=1 Tax=Anguilla anguilla TaxID=7936 RepID=A0A0E9VQ57_ANGAN
MAPYWGFPRAQN